MNGEKYARAIVKYIQECNKHYFTNNYTTRKLTGLSCGQLREGTKELKRREVLVRYGPGVYQVNWRLISKNQKS